MLRKLCIAVVIALVMARVSCAGLYSNVLVNPGFEIGSSISEIEGWGCFNSAFRYADPVARSGSNAVVAWGNWWPTNDWNASGVFQEYPASRGQIWEASVWAMAGSNPQGRAYGGLSIEFYTAATQAIFSAMSAHKITSSTPTGQWFQITAKAQATPNTAFVRLIPLFLQSPDFEVGAVWFDDVSLYLVPTSTIAFAGQEWNVIDGISSPGPNNHYSTNCVTVDSNGWLHMEVKNIDGVWYCPFLESTNHPGFGEYRWYLGSRVDLLDSNLVAGLFNYAQEPVYGTNEIEVDIEFSHALPGTQTNCLLYTVQPYTITGNGYQHPMVLTNDITTHRFFWRPDRVDWQSYYGHTAEPDTNNFIGGWRFEGRGIPIETNEHIYMNLWLFYTNSPADTQGLEMIIHDFVFTPFNGFMLADEFDDGVRSNIWDALGADVAETNGALLVTPSETNPAGYATAERIHRNERGTRYVFTARLRSVTVSSARAGDDVAGMMTLSAATNVALAARSAALLEARYDEAPDTLTLAFFTKANQPGSEGTAWFEGTLTNASARIAAGGVDLRMELDRTMYRVGLRDADGFDITLTTNFGADAGVHGLQEYLSNCTWFVGARNIDGSSAGSVEWDRAELGIAGQAEDFPLSVEPAESGALCLSADGFFDTKYSVLRTTNLAEPFIPVATGLPVRGASVLFTGEVESTSAAFYRMKME